MWSGSARYPQAARHLGRKTCERRTLCERYRGVNAKEESQVGTSARGEPRKTRCEYGLEGGRGTGNVLENRVLTAMGAEELWVESYQGEVLGEALFGALAERQEDPDRRGQLDVLTLLERSTKQLAEPIFDKRGLDRGDTDGTLAQAKELTDAVAAIAWEEFLGSFAAITDQFVEKYLQLVDLAPDDEERHVAEAYVAHERALAAFARRALGEEAGEPLELILALPHVVAITA